MWAAAVLSHQSWAWVMDGHEVVMESWTHEVMNSLTWTFEEICYGSMVRYRCDYNVDVCYVDVVDVCVCVIRDS